VEYAIFIDGKVVKRRWLLHRDRCKYHNMKVTSFSTALMAQIRVVY